MRIGAGLEIRRLSDIRAEALFLVSHKSGCEVGEIEVFGKTPLFRTLEPPLLNAEQLFVIARAMKKMQGGKKA